MSTSGRGWSSSIDGSGGQSGAQSPQNYECGSIILKGNTAVELWSLTHADIRHPHHYNIPKGKITYAALFSKILEDDYKPIYESGSIIPTYVVDRFLAENPGQKGFFCVSKTVSDPISQGRISLHIDGHLFEMTWWGTLKYHGNFWDNLRQLSEKWKALGWKVRDTKDPMTDDLHYIKRQFMPPNQQGFMTTIGPPGENSRYTSDYVQHKPFDGTNYFREELLENHKFTMLEGSYRRLGKWPQKSYQAPTYNLWINLPKLVAQIISMGLVEAKDVGRYMYPLNEQPEGLSYAVGLRNPFGEWQDGGWSYTRRKGMDILVG